MPRYCSEISLSEEPPKKKNCNNYYLSSCNLKSGEIIKDIQGKQWKLGKVVGVGGFGEIYLASDTGEIETDCPYVAKIERHTHGPLFVEINCYLRIAKDVLIEKWKTEKKLSSLGMPHYVAFGSHTYKNERYRFLIMPRYDIDLEKILEEKMKLNLKTVLTISCQILDVLEYIHSNGYVHSDIKASNILLNYQKKKKKKNVINYSPPKTRKYPCGNPVRACRIKPKSRNLRPIRQSINYFDDILNFDEMICEEYNSNEDFSAPKQDLDTISNNNNNNADQIYLLDYGLACKFISSNGIHKPFCVDERKAHAGTISFCSRDAHKGVQSRRSDLESLGYNMIYWLTGNLPWIKDAEYPEIVEKQKYKAFADPDHFLHSCFKHQYPKYLLDYFYYLQKLQFQDKPEYGYLKNLFKSTLQQYGYKDDSRFDFDNLEGWGRKQKKLTSGRENVKIKRIVYKVSRPPLVSNNIPIKPLLRKKIKNKINKAVHWSQILIDPEILLRQARKDTEIETNYASNISEQDLLKMNPTAAMIEVFNKSKERCDSSPTQRGDIVINQMEGYTPAMLAVLQRMTERQQLELEKFPSIKDRKRMVKSKKKNNTNPARMTRLKAVTVKLENLKIDCAVELRKEKSALKRGYSLRG